MSKPAINKNSNDYRHQCEVRALCRWRYELGRDYIDTFLSNVEKKRGTEARSHLEADVRNQWTLGNRGKNDDWRE